MPEEILDTQEQTSSQGPNNLLVKITQTVSPVLIFGLGLHWVWLYAIYYSAFPSLVLTSGLLSTSQYPFGFVFLVFFIIVTFGMGAFSSRITFFIRRRRFQTLVAIILSLSTGCLFLSNVVGFLPLLIISEAVNGLASGFFLLLWGEGYRRREPLAILSNSVLSVVAAFIIFRFIMFLLPPNMASILFIVTPLVMFGLLYLALHGRKAFTQPQQFTVSEEGTKIAAPGLLEIPTFHRLKVQRESFFIKIGIPFLFFGIALKLLCDMVFRSAIEPAYLSMPWDEFLISTIVPCIIMFIVATIFVATNQSDDCEQYYRYIIPIASVFILFACFQEFDALSSVFTSTSYLCLEFMIWMELCVISHRYRISPILVAGFGRGALAVGMLLVAIIAATPLNTLVHIDAGLSFTLMIVMLIVGFSLLPREQDIKEMAIIDQSDSSAESDEADDTPQEGQRTGTEKRFIARCEKVANTYLLSPREVDVFFLLAKGRNTAYISKNLYISEGTVHTHMRHIYKKLDIHRQQELIDMVDAQFSQANQELINSEKNRNRS